MTLVRTLDCPDYEIINNEIARWVERQQIPGDVFWNPAPVRELISQCPKFTEWMYKMDVLISSVAITYGKTPSCCDAHIDTPPARFKLSWPIKNAIGTWNRWFRLKGDDLGTINALGGSSYQYCDLIEIHRHQLTGPCIIDAGTIHDVWCDDDAQFPRIGLQCQLYKEPISL